VYGSPEPANYRLFIERPRATDGKSGMNTDLFEIIRTTRSMRRLRPDPVPLELIRQILEAGTAAPPGGNANPWRFLVVQDQAIKNAVGHAYRRHWHETAGPWFRSGGPGTGAPASGVPRDRYDRMLDGVGSQVAWTAPEPPYDAQCQCAGTSHRQASQTPAH
jgi:nitroreductase